LKGSNAKSLELDFICLLELTRYSDSNMGSFTDLIKLHSITWFQFD
jgi:hypothetical protein